MKDKRFGVCYEDSCYPYIEISGFGEGETKKAIKYIKEIQQALKLQQLIKQRVSKKHFSLVPKGHIPHDIISSITNYL